MKNGRGNLAVKVTNSCPACHKFEPCAAEDPTCRGRRSIHHGKETPSFEHHTGDRTILALFHPNLEGEHPGGGQRSPTSFLSTNLTRRLAARRLFKVPPCREGTMHLQTSVSSQGFEPKSNGTAGIVANHYT
ncbi:hypothetical protein TNCV_4415621 [Trichonephila clavipes]|uniref:Uncharacterized protein n=1 Tax=Trichonephila clavipes TaxID=2585209 RepID=A0A8X6V9L9_TRICX|nr:hypothetical protein TNCV_4415621 [Trichonephila clavipes]